VKSGSGVTRMTGDNTGFSGTVDVVAGELRGPIASFGANRVITNAGLVSFVESGDAVWDGAITGSGSLRVTGGGRFEIVGSNNTYSGNTLSRRMQTSRQIHAFTCTPCRSNLR